MTEQPERFYQCQRCRYFFAHAQLEAHAVALGNACAAAVLCQLPRIGAYSIGGAIPLFDDDRAYCPSCVRCPVDVRKYDRTVPRQHFEGQIPSQRRWPVKRTSPWVSITAGLGAFILTIALLLMAAAGFFRGLGGK